jgi:hypothetical protein
VLPYCNSTVESDYVTRTLCNRSIEVKLQTDRSQNLIDLLLVLTSSWLGDCTTVLSVAGNCRSCIRVRIRQSTSIVYWIARKSYL